MSWTLSLFISCLLGLNILLGTDYYVSNEGDDSNDGLSLDMAFETLQHAADLVVPGDHVYVADGNYVGFALWSGGTMEAPISFSALGENACINMPGPTTDGINIENADNVIIDGFIVKNQPRNGIRLALSDHCVVRNCWCDNNYERGIFTGFTDDILIENNVCSNSIDEHGIYISNSSDRSIIRYNECYGNNNIGIHMNGDLSQGGDGIISDPQIYGNYIHDNNLAAGINLDGVENPVIYNNLIVNNHFAQGIALFQIDGAIVTQGAKIYNNTIIVPSDGRWGILVRDGANQNTEIYNNIIINQHDWRGSITCESLANFESDYNILSNSLSNQGDGQSISLGDWQNLGLDQNSLLADPIEDLFYDPSMNEFRILPNSQAVDAGINSPSVSSIVSVDFEEKTRPLGATFDIGAFEHFPETHTIRYQVSTNALDLVWNDQPDVVIVEGDLQDYEINLLTQSDQVLTDFSNQSSPVVICLWEYGEDLLFLSIENNMNPYLSVRTMIRP